MDSRLATIRADRDRYKGLIYEMARQIARDIDPWEEYPEGRMEQAPGSRFRLLWKTDDCMVIVAQMKEAGLFPEHIHSRAVSMIGVVRGKVRVRREEGAKILERGQSCNIRAGQVHATSWSAGAEIIFSFVREP